MKRKISHMLIVPILGAAMGALALAQSPARTGDTDRSALNPAQTDAPPRPTDDTRTAPPTTANTTDGVPGRQSNDKAATSDTGRTAATGSADRSSSAKDATNGSDKASTKAATKHDAKPSGAHAAKPATKESSRRGATPSSQGATDSMRRSGEGG